MTPSTPPRRSARIVGGFIIGLIVLGYGLFRALPHLANIVVDFWWFDRLNLGETFRTRLSAQILLGLIGFAVALIIFGWVYHRLRQAFRLAGFATDSHLGRWAGYLVVFLISLLAGKALSSEYLSFLLWRSHESFGQTDPFFHRSYDFYVFTLPFLNIWVGFFLKAITKALIVVGLGLIVVRLTTGHRLLKLTQGSGSGFKSLLIGLVAALFGIPFLGGILEAMGFDEASFPIALVIVGTVIYYWFRKQFRTNGWSIFRAEPNGYTPPRPQDGFTKLAGQLFGLLLLVWAYGAWLDRYNLIFKGTSDVVPSTSWLDVSYTSYYILVIIACYLAWGLLLLLGRASTKTHCLILGTVFLVGLIGNHALPSLIRKVYIKPNELLIESPYLTEHVNATRAGFGLDLIDEVDYQPNDSLTVADVASAQDTLKNIRVWDYRAFNTANNQLQALRTFYYFQDADIDRYKVNNERRQLLVSARELNLNGLPSADSQKWLLPFTYTHSYGLTAARANQANDQGQPEYLLKDIPPVADDPNLKVTSPRMYFSEAPLLNVFLGTSIREVDPATDASTRETNATASQLATETVGIGFPVDSFWKRVMIAFHQGFDSNILFSKFISSGESEYVINRSISTRLAGIAPMVTWDRDPYPVIRENGSIIWIIDGYTSTTNYPLAARFEHSQKNYMRNSVKATVDALTGDTHLYLWDQLDPIGLSWQKVFPEVFEPAANLPSDLLAHIRYPADLFKLQTQMYNRYHVTEPLAFYSNEDRWVVPKEVLDQGGSASTMDAYYNIVNLPGFSETGGEFVLLRPSIPYSKLNMTAWFAGRSDWPNTGQLVVYRLPGNKLISGPNQIATRIDQDPELSKIFSLWNQGGSQVIRGGMYVLPVGQTMLSVQSIYLQSSNNPIPELKLVVLTTEDQLVFAPTAQEALQKLTVKPN